MGDLSSASSPLSVFLLALISQTLHNALGVPKVQLGFALQEEGFSSGCISVVLSYAKQCVTAAICP